MNDRLAETRWGALSFEDTGGSSRPIVFLHGGAANLRVWDNVIPALTDSFRCVSFDLPGNGLTPIAPLTFAQLSEALFDACTVLKISLPLLVGHSFGGLASAVIANSGNLVSGVVAIDPYLSDKEVRRDFNDLDEALEEVRAMNWPWPDTFEVFDEVERILKTAYRPRPNEANLRAMIRRGYRQLPNGAWRRYPRREDEMKGVEANWSVNVLDTFKGVNCPLAMVVATSISAARLERRRELVKAISREVADFEYFEFECEHDIPGYMPDELGQCISTWAGLEQSRQRPELKLTAEADL